MRIANTRGHSRRCLSPVFPEQTASRLQGTNMRPPSRRRVSPVVKLASVINQATALAISYGVPARFNGVRAMMPA